MASGYLRGLPVAPLLSNHNIVCLHTFLSLAGAKLDALPLAQAALAIAISANRLEVNKDVFAAIAGDKTETLAVIKPFNLPLLPGGAAACGLASWL